MVYRASSPAFLLPIARGRPIVLSRYEGKIDDSDSLNMRLGLTAGRSFNRPDGQNVGNLYVKAGVNHDFLGKTKIRMNEFDFKTRSLGTRFYFGVGGELVIGNQWKAFAQIGGEHGNRLNVDLSCKAGIKYSF